MSEMLELGISAEVAQKIREHGVETYPHECCGALLGRDGGFTNGLDSSEEIRKASREVLALYSLVNRRDDSPRNRFSVSSDDVREAEKVASTQGLEIVGWYHSHPDHPARPSEYDRDHAWPWYSYIIVSVHSRVPQDMTSWRLKDDRSGFFEEKIESMKVSAAS
ncbi:MAG: Mov34/MPN/PAD-1 family protein [Candidatus Acidiferrum sp.]